jgi:hypothetical protein
VQCGKKLSFGGGDSGSNKRKRGYGDANGGVWRSLSLAGVWSQAAGFVLVHLAGIWLQSPWRFFSHLIDFIKKFYKCCIFNAICKDNAAINCTIVQHNIGSFPSTTTGHTLG